MNLLFNYYPVTLERPGIRPELLELDQVTVAGALTEVAQRELAKVAPFAELAYRTLHDEAYVRSLLIRPAMAETILTRDRMKKTHGKWFEHTKKLKSWSVLADADTLPAIRERKFQARLISSSYFAVSKSNGLARSIFGGAALSRLFLRPPPVNLPSLPFVLGLLCKHLRGKKFFMISCDLRHYFHQIAISLLLAEFFTIYICGLVLAFIVLPMGWSYSPRCAQSFAWSALLALASYDNGLATAAASFLACKPEHPPAFLFLHNRNNEIVGLLLVWYDNFVAWCTDEKIVNGLNSTFNEMTRRFGFVWGERHSWPPRMLSNAPLCASNESGRGELIDPLPTDTIGIALGLQFAMKVKRGRTEPDHHIVWRLKPKTSAKAQRLLQVRNWDCRSLAGVIGSRIWQVYASTSSLATIGDLLDLSSKVGVCAHNASWNAQYILGPDEEKIVAIAIDHIIRNPWFPSTNLVLHESCHSNIFLASDATKKHGAWVRYESRYKRADYHRWPWTAEELFESIFLLELRAAVAAIMTNGVANSIVVIVIDNTAAAAVLRLRYSSTKKGREIIARLDAFVQEHSILLVVAGIAGEDNDSDTPSRFAFPPWSAERLTKTWDTAHRALLGCERVRLNPEACPFTHSRELADREDTPDRDALEDGDCESLNNAVMALNTATDLTELESVESREILEAPSP